MGGGQAGTLVGGGQAGTLVGATLQEDIHACAMGEGGYGGSPSGEAG